MFCPVCKRAYKFYETRCNYCEVDLVADRPAGAPDPEGGSVSVFEASDPGMISLATMALEGEGIDFSTHTGGLSAVFGSRWIGEAAAPGNMGAVTEIVVAADLADRAREVLAGLAEGADPVGEPASARPPAPTSASAPAVVAGASFEAPNIELRDSETGDPLGSITAGQLQFLKDHLEEESATDDDYYIDAATIDMLTGVQADAGLIELLRRGLGAREGMEVCWSKP